MWTAPPDQESKSSLKPNDKVPPYAKAADVTQTKTNTVRMVLFMALLLKVPGAS
jgi:hypothetical protein